MCKIELFSVGLNDHLLNSGDIAMSIYNNEVYDKLYSILK